MTRSQESRENKHAHQFHPDGEQESIINDSTASAGKQMGIAIDMDPKNPHQHKDSFNYTPHQDPELKEFQDVFKPD